MRPAVRTSTAPRMPGDPIAPRVLVRDRARKAVGSPGPAETGLDQVARHRGDLRRVGGSPGSQGDVLCVHIPEIECNEHTKISRLSRKGKSGAGGACLAWRPAE